VTSGAILWWAGEVREEGVEVLRETLVLHMTALYIGNRDRRTSFVFPSLQDLESVSVLRFVAGRS